MAIAMTLSFSACSDDNDPTPGPDSQPELSDYHFDIFMTIGKHHGGMNQGEGTIVKSVNSLTADMGVIDIKKDGVEFIGENNTYSMENILKGKYYYQVPNSADRFTKFQVIGNSIRIAQEQIFEQNTYKVRGYTHAWLDDNTLIIMAANGDADKVIWTKLNADDMRILAEGTLDLPLPEGAKVFTASGILTYNEKAGKLYYFYFGKDKSGRGGKATSNFLTAVINPSDMKVESNKVNTLAGEMAGSAYGELMQSCVMYVQMATSTWLHSPMPMTWNKVICSASRKVKQTSMQAMRDIPTPTVNCSPSKTWVTVKPSCMHVMMQPVLPSTATATTTPSSTSIPEHGNA